MSKNTSNPHTKIIIALVVLVAVVTVVIFGFQKNEPSSAPVSEGEEGALAGNAMKFQKVAVAPANACNNVQGCGFVTVAQLDANDEHGLPFGGCPRGSTSSVCVDRTRVLCTGSAELGDRIIDCGGNGCSGNYPSSGCWGVPRGRESSHSFAFGGCPRGSTSSICVSANDVFCMGSTEFGDQVISCGDRPCGGDFPRARCN